MMEKFNSVRWLLDRVADMSVRNIFDDTAFHIVAKKGFLEILKSFCEHGVSIDVVGEEDFTALNYALQRDFDEIAKYFIKREASLDIPDSVSNETPFDRMKKKNKKTSDFSGEAQTR